MFKYEAGDEIELKDIRPGDKITFVTVERALKTGTVHRAILLDNGIRRTAYVDENNWVLNQYPDVDTIAYVVSLESWGTGSNDTADIATREAVTVENFSDVPVWTVYGFEEHKSRGYLFIKQGPDKWMRIDTGSYGSFDIYEADDADVLESASYEGKMTDYPLN